MKSSSEPNYQEEEFMSVQTNVTLLLPKRKIYCDFSFNLNPTKLFRDPTDLLGVWEETTWKPCPPRPGYTRRNPFDAVKGDAFVERNTHAILGPTLPGEGGARVNMFEFGYIAKTRGVPLPPPPVGYAVIVVDIRTNAFPLTGREAWAKKTYLIPQMEEIFGIFWG
ncbi:MAG: hypothetical protein JSS81_29080 [Acidobacteria bacterium]|nr:hypothetical protein [Acidobacteriota bacterium]